jgi:hypothetical protein
MIIKMKIFCKNVLKVNQLKLKQKNKND